MSTERKRAAIYVRASDPYSQGDNYSRPTQEEACRAHAARRGYRVSEPYVYREMHTAVELEERPVLGECLDAMARGEFDVLICYDPDRFSRKQVHTAILLHYCEQANIQLEFAQFDFENSPTGTLILQIRAYAAEMEHDKIRERTVRGMRARVRSGKLKPGRFPLHGYRWTEGRAALDVDESTAAVVRQIFAWALEGLSLREIVERLNAERIPRPRPDTAHWYRNVVLEILRNPAYKGEAWSNRFKRVKRPQHRPTHAPRPEEEWIRQPDGTIPALVEPGDWEAVQRRLARNRVEAPRRSAQPEAFLLRAGYVVCGCCRRTANSILAKQRNGTSRPVYRVLKGDERHRGCVNVTVSARSVDQAVENY